MQTAQSIRHATVADARSIARIHVETWRTAYRDLLPPAFLSSLSIEKREIGWENNLRENTDHVLVVEQSGKLRAWISFGHCRDEGESVEAEIYALYVEADAQRSGLGAELLRNAEAELRLHLPTARRISLWVLATNLPARSFYERRGYQISPRTKSEQIGGTPQLELRYEKIIS